MRPRPPCIEFPPREAAGHAPLSCAAETDDGQLQAADKWRRAAPWSLSAGLHVVLLAGLACWMLPLAFQRASTPLTASSLDTEAVVDVLPAVRFADADFGSNEPATSTSLDNNALVFNSPPSGFADVGLHPTRALPANSPHGAIDMLRGLTHRQLTQELAVQEAPAPRAAGGAVRSAKGATAALDAVLADVRRKANEGDLLVVWLFDASLSLVDDREQVARRLKPFFNEEIKQRQEQDGRQIQNAAVAFGAATVELVKPSKLGGNVAAAIRKVPIDVTGLENVMTAVQTCVVRYRRQNHKWQGNVLIVVWTDESGNDVALLEETISLCRSEGVAVSVVGPSAVLGAARGLHRYTDPATGGRFLLPVDRGPDSALPERPLLPYWFGDVMSPWQQAGALVGDNAKWYGGSHREGLLSGFGPHALTRLALETGGSFTLLDRPGDEVVFEPEKLADYRPEYGSLESYRRDIDGHALRRAVMKAVARTYSSPFQHPPTLEYFRQRYPTYPFKTYKIYYLPGEFHLKLAAQMATDRLAATAALQNIETALDAFGAVGMETERQSEKSPRWRAWYDVTRGRLLAAAVRLREYQLTCDAVLTGNVLAPQVNWLALRPHDVLRGGRRSQSQADEARRLLTRCVSEHQDTPWAWLAKWELEHPLGLNIVQETLSPPLSPLPPPGPAISLPSF